MASPRFTNRSTRVFDMDAQSPLTPTIPPFTRNLIPDDDSPLVHVQPPATPLSREDKRLLRNRTRKIGSILGETLGETLVGRRVVGPELGRRSGEAVRLGVGEDEDDEEDDDDALGVHDDLVEIPFDYNSDGVPRSPFFPVPNHHNQHDHDSLSKEPQSTDGYLSDPELFSPIKDLEFQGTLLGNAGTAGLAGIKGRRRSSSMITTAAVAGTGSTMTNAKSSSEETRSVDDPLSLSPFPSRSQDRAGSFDVVDQGCEDDHARANSSFSQSDRSSTGIVPTSTTSPIPTFNLPIGSIPPTTPSSSEQRNPTRKNFLLELSRGIRVLVRQERSVVVSPVEMGGGSGLDHGRDHGCDGSDVEGEGEMVRTIMNRDKLRRRYSTPVSPSFTPLLRSSNVTADHPDSSTSSSHAEKAANAAKGRPQSSIGFGFLLNPPDLGEGWLTALKREGRIDSLTCDRVGIDVQDRGRENEEMSLEEKRSRRERLNKLHRLLGTRVPLELITRRTEDRLVQPEEGIMTPGEKRRAVKVANKMLYVFGQVPPARLTRSSSETRRSDSIGRTEEIGSSAVKEYMFSLDSLQYMLDNDRDGLDEVLLDIEVERSRAVSETGTETATRTRKKRSSSSPITPTPDQSGSRVTSTVTREDFFSRRRRAGKLTKFFGDPRVANEDF